MTKPCLPYTGQFADNLRRTAELYPTNKRAFSMGGSTNVHMTARDGHRPELTRGVNGK